MERQELKTRNPNAIVIVLLIVILVLLGYIIYNYVITEKKIEASNNVVENQAQLENDPTNNENSAAEDLAREIYNYYNISAGSIENTDIRQMDLHGLDNFFKDAYSDKKVLINDLLTDEEKIIVAVNWLKNSQVSVWNDGYNITTKFLVENCKLSYEKFWGSIENVEFTTFEGYDLGTCRIEGDLYVCENGPTGHISSPYDLFMKYKDYEYTNDEIYIYEYVVASFREKAYATLDYGETTDDGFTNEIVELRDLTPEKVFSGDNLSKLSVYKHTFKQNNEGSYYWYSTEPVK